MAAEDRMGEQNRSLAISQLRSAEDLIRKVDSLKRGRSVAEREWKLNLAFYRGRQYSWYNPWTRRIETLGVDDGEKPRYRIRLVSNQIVTGCHSLLSKLLKTKPTLSATPGSGSVNEAKAAQMAERLLEHWWTQFDLDSKLEEALLWGVLGGQGFWKISWDEHAGTPMRFMMAPDGSPILDDAMKDAFRAELEQFQMEPEEQVVYLGDIRVDVLSPFHVFLDTSAKQFEDCQYAFCKHYLDPDEIRVRYGVDLAPDSVSATSDETLPMDNAEDRANKTVKEVWTGYFKPSPALPNGRVVAFCDSPKMILQDGPWPYPSHDLPLVKFPGVRVPGSVYDDSITTHARPLQKELNKTLSQIVEYKNLMVRPRVWAPVGSLRTKITTEAGAAFEYLPIQGMKPEPEQLPTLPAYVFEHLKDINARLNEIFGLTEVTEGSVPPNVEAGVAIDLLQEMATDRFAPTIKLIETSLARGGQLMLSLAQEYYKEPRLLKIKGSGGSVQVKRFTQADIQGGIDIRAETGSGLPRTRAGRQAHIMKLVELGVLPMEKAYKHLDIADLKGVTAGLQADEDKAQREHEKLISGIPLNPEAIQKAMMDVNSGVNPETGEPLMPQDAQMLLMRASVAPSVADNHAIHADNHALFMKSLEFDSLPPEARQRFITHYEMTLDAMPQTGENAPKVSTSLRAAIGPTVLAELLKSNGIDITPEIAAEPPLETWVTDSVDKPDTDQDGPGQSGAELAGKLQTIAHAEALQEQKLREGKAKADLAEKKTRQSDFKPKPKPKQNK